jgi:glycosyltransferase involved in cell wall biosynthesis
MKHGNNKDNEPLVSIGIPLYRSKPFVTNIISNLESIKYNNLEIIISDRHCKDDAIEILHRYFSSDPRYIFIKEKDQIGWVEHYNMLCINFKGKYFLWMPHDDIYSPNYIAEIVKILENKTEIICGFGHLNKISEDGLRIEKCFSRPPLIRDETWELRETIKLFYWGFGRCFRGVFRTEVIKSSGLYIKETLNNVGADSCWMFGISFLGKIQYVDNCYCNKRFYANSTSAKWTYSLGHVINRYLVLVNYMNYSSLKSVERGFVIINILIYCTFLYVKKRLNIKVLNFSNKRLKKIFYKLTDLFI